MYDNYTHLNAYNPLLTGKAYASDQIQYDIDSNVRHYPYTIGANEICISSLPTDTFFISCGDSIQLQLCNYIDSAEYFWSPLFNITDPFVFNPIVSPDIDTTYYVSMYLNSELIFTDSFRISINQLPVAMATYIMIEPNVQFINNSKCAQAYIWDFGDGSSDSTSHNPSHQYLNVGFYDVKLIAINSFGSDTCYIPITIMSTEIKEEIFSEFLVYPNPAKSKIFIDSNGNIHDARISIYNIHGQLLMQQPLEQETSEIALGSLANGVYFIQLRNENSVLIRKIIKD